MDYLNYIYPVLGVGTLVAVFLMSFKNGRNTSLAEVQEKTITALQTQINTMKDKISDLEKENTLQGHLIELITSALKKKGMIVTIDGDMITISGKDGNSTTIARQSSAGRHRTITTQQSATVTKKEEI